MDEKDQNAFAADVLYKLVTSKEKRLKYGAEAREAMQKLLKEGKKVEGYRAEWIIDTMNEVIDTLIKSSEKFNMTYFHDYISTQDLCDVLQSTLSKLQKAKK